MKCFKCFRYLSTVSLLLLTFLFTSLGAGPAAAQTLTVSNGATFFIDNGAVLDLGATTTLVEDEASGARLTGGTGVVTATRTLNAPSAVDVAGLGAVITSAADLGTTTVTRGFVPQTANGNEGIARYFDVAPATNNGLDATLAFTYFDAEMNGQDEATFVLFRSEDGGATWDQAGGTVDLATNTVTFAGIDAFSRWTVASEEAPLPVELASFTASVEGQAVVLSWKTLSEKGSARFAIERATGSVETRDLASLPWQTLATVEAAGTTTEAQSYTYRAEDLDYGTYTFRLRQEDLDGTTAVLGEVEAVVGLSQAYALSEVYPNPFRQNATLEVAVREGQRVRVEVYDVLGRRVATVFDEQVPGNDTRRVRFGGSRLSSGVYFVRVVGLPVRGTQTGEDFSETRRFVVAR